MVDASILKVVSDEVELEDLLGKDTNAGKHAHTAVLDLSLTE
jgi:hypothetical protein